MKKSLLALSAMALVLAACAPESSRNTSDVQLTDETAQIMGGQVVTADSLVAQSTVAVFDGQSESICTGTLIHDDLVLTAAHCVNPKNFKGLLIVFQRQFTRNYSDLRIVANVIVNEKYAVNSNGLDNRDLALIRFVGSVPKGYRPADLITDASKLTVGSELIVAGFGVDWANYGNVGKTGTLRSLTMKVRRPLHGMSEMLLEQTATRGICFGDSGGPAYVNKNGKLYLVGVTSRVTAAASKWGPGCLSNAVSTRIDKNADWLATALTKIYKN